MGEKQKRVGRVRLRRPLDGGGYENLNIGAIITSPYQGTYSLILEVDTDEKTPEGWTKRDKILAFKDAAGNKVDIEGCFINIDVYDEMAAKPPRQD